jgi:hypothetical protein
MFHLNDDGQEICFPLEWKGIRGEYTPRDVWKRKDLGMVSEEVCQSIGPHGSRLFRLKKNTSEH